MPQQTRFASTVSKMGAAHPPICEVGPPARPRWAVTMLIDAFITGPMAAHKDPAAPDSQGGRWLQPSRLA